MNNMHIQIPATVLSIESDQVHFQLEDGQKVVVQKQLLKPSVGLGEQFVITVQPAEEAALEQEALAKTLLNQLLS